MNSSEKLLHLLQTVIPHQADRERLMHAMNEAGVTPEKSAADRPEIQPSPPPTATAASTASPTATASWVDGADVDLGRVSRCGFAEVVYAEGKPAQLVVDVFRTQQQAGQNSLATRISAEQATALLQAFPSACYNETARTVRLQNAQRKSKVAEEVAGEVAKEVAAEVAVVTAGSCDLPVAAEAVETLTWMGIPCVLIEDVGVAGPQRLLKHVPALQQMSCVVCVAGMEAALPSVLGGHVRCPVIGVPTSVGYGASFMGLAALLSMLNSCSSNVVTVNIDAGFRGGYVAGMIAAGRTHSSVAQRTQTSQNEKTTAAPR